MEEKNCFDIAKLLFQIRVCHCDAVVNEFLARADIPGSTPGDAAFCFFVSFFFVYFFKHYFPFWPFLSLFLLQTLLVMHLGSMHISSLSPGFYFRKRISKALDLHTGQAYGQVKTISCQDMSLL